MSFEASKFHQLCDRKGKTVTLITTSTGNICGGFTSVSWASGYNYATDKEAFLFSLDSGK
jgi:formate/nitrite transporter FocA (FNT family)